MGVERCGAAVAPHTDSLWTDDSRRATCSVKGHNFVFTTMSTSPRTTRERMLAAKRQARRRERKRAAMGDREFRDAENARHRKERLEKAAADPVAVQRQLKRAATKAKKEEDARRRAARLQQKLDVERYATELRAANPGAPAIVSLVECITRCNRQYRNFCKWQQHVAAGNNEERVDMGLADAVNWDDLSWLENNVDEYFHFVRNMTTKGGEPAPPALRSKAVSCFSSIFRLRSDKVAVKLWRRFLPVNKELAKDAIEFAQHLKMSPRELKHIVPWQTFTAMRALSAVDEVLLALYIITPPRR
jgi:hypothetical protein